MIVTECSDRQKEIKAAVEEVQRAVETKQAAKLEALEQRSVQHTDQRITQHIEQCTERTRALRDVIATESWDRQKEIKAAGEEAHRAVETKLEALEQRLKAVPQASNRRIINGGSRSISASGTSSRKWADVSGPAHCTRPSARSQLSLRENLRHQINAAT
jgi:BMFP domain-containing protein YqiC